MIDGRNFHDLPVKMTSENENIQKFAAEQGDDYRMATYLIIHTSNKIRADCNGSK